MKKLPRKGAVGAIIYIQRLHLEDTKAESAPPAVAELLEQYSAIFQEPIELPP
jgi:hypothetical protein